VDPHRRADQRIEDQIAVEGDPRAGVSLGWGEPVAVAKPDDFPLSRCCRFDPDFPAVTKADWYDPDLNPDIPCSRDNCRDNSCSRCRSNWVTFF